jgi:hypothetical protein
MVNSSFYCKARNYSPFIKRFNGVRIFVFASGEGCRGFELQSGHTNDYTIGIGC